MQAKAFLNQTYRLESRIESKKARLQYWKDLAVSITSSIENTGHSSEVSRKIENCSIKILELEDEILSDIEKLVFTERKVKNAINSLSHPQYKNILEKRYLLHMSFEQIAVSEGYTYRWVQTLHKRALKYFEESVLVPEISQ